MCGDSPWGREPGEKCARHLVVAASAGWQVWETWERSGDADQLPVGPIQAFILVGFILWALQIVAEIIKTGFIIIGRNDLAALEVADAPLRVE